MQREQIVLAGANDFSGHFPGERFPAADLPSRPGSAAAAR